MADDAAETAGQPSTDGRHGHEHAAAHQAVRRNSTGLRLPIVGEVLLPPPQQLAWYGGIATLAVLEIIEWPVAVVLGIGHALLQDRHNKALEDFGQALEEA